jgi:hypothetical protein
MINKPHGTRGVGYMTPENGPFDCGHCKHFHVPNLCDEDEVVADPELRKVKQGERELAIVSSRGCCNEFQPEAKINDVPFVSIGF